MLNILKYTAFSTVLLSVLLTGCGGGGGGGSASSPTAPAGSKKVTVSGVVQKGLFTRLDVSAFPVDPDSGKLGQPLPVEVVDQTYSVEVDPDQVLLLEAKGTFLNEVDGAPVNLDKPLKTILAVNEQNASANVNLFTTLAAQRTLEQLPVSTTPAADQIRQQEIFVNNIFSLPASTSPAQLDFRNISASSPASDPNLSLLLASTAVLQTMQGGQFDAASLVDLPTVISGSELLPVNTVLPGDIVLVDGSTILAGQLLPEDIVVASVPASTGNASRQVTQFYADGFDAVMNSVLGAATPAAAASELAMLNAVFAADLYQLARSNSGYTFLPDLNLNPGMALNCSANGGCTWLQPASPSILVSALDTYEAYGYINVKVMLNRALTGTDEVNVELSTVAQSATPGEDYFPIKKQLRFSAGTSTIVTQIPVLIDDINEPDETLAIEITTDSTVYSLASSRLDVRILDGAPPYLQNPDSQNIEIGSFSVRELCDQTGQCDFYTSLGLVDGAINRLRAEVDLAAACTDPANCPEQGSDWLLDIFMVARDAQGVSQEEQRVAQYVYNRDSVQLQNDPPLVRQPYLALSSSQLATLVDMANTAGQSLYFEVRLAGAAKRLTAQFAKPVYLLPASVIAGGLDLPLSSVSNVTPGNGSVCPAGDLLVTGEYALPGVPVPAGPAGGPVPPGSADTATLVRPRVSGSLCLTPDSNDPLAPATVSGDLSLPVTSGLYLDDGSYVRIKAVVRATGESMVVYSMPLALAFPATPMLSFDLETWLHHEGWPLEFKLDSIRLGAGGLSLAYSDIRYVQQRNYSSQDPRFNSLPASNDIYYSQVSAQNGALIYDSNGLQAGFQVGASAAAGGKLAFPLASLQWNGFQQDISGSQMQAVSLDATAFSMRQSTACQQSGCSQDIGLNWNASPAGARLDSRGFLLATATVASQPVVFGAREDGSFSWARPDDLVLQDQARLALAGYRIPANAQRISDYLLAHLNETGSGDLDLYPLGSRDFIDGNYHPVGLSLGPEIYRNPQGQPVVGDGQDLNILGARLQINNGFDAPFDLLTSPGVKYVIRPAGITGVFNVRDSAISTTTPFYGYPLSLSRFAVRLADNRMDRQTWIDGQLVLGGHLGGTEGFGVFFENLEIDCAARLGKMDLIYEQCDGVDNNNNGVTDENCSPRMAAWKAPTDIYTAGFDQGTSPGQSCSAGETQLFSLEHDVIFHALDKPVLFLTLWDTQGDFQGGTGSAQARYRFDRSEDGAGFVASASNIELDVANVSGETMAGWASVTARSRWNSGMPSGLICDWQTAFP